MKDMEVWVRTYHSSGFTNPKILKALRPHYNTEKDGLGFVTCFAGGMLLIGECRLTTLKAWLREWGLKSSRAQAHTFDTISGPIQEIKKFPPAGAESTRHHLSLKFNVRVPRCALALTASPMGYSPNSKDGSS